MKDLFKVLALMALLVIAGFQTCSNSRLAATAQTNDTYMKVNNDRFTTALNQPVLLPVLANDTINPETSTVIFSSPESGTIVHAGKAGGFRYLPRKDFTGTDHFEYRVCIGETCKTASVELTVN